MENTIPREVILHEVVLRDGIQNEKTIIPTEEKIKLILFLGLF